MNTKSLFALSFMTLLVKNSSPFVITWSVAQYLTTTEFNLIFTTLAAVGFVSAAGSLNLLFTAQSLYGHEADRSELVNTFHEIFFIRIIVFAALGYIYYIIVNLENSIYLFFSVLIVRMLYDYSYGLLKITGRFKEQLAFVFLNLSIICVIPIMLKVTEASTTDIIGILVLSEFIPVILFALIHAKLVRLKSIYFLSFRSISILLPGIRLLGLSLFLPLINNTFYIRMVNLGYHEPAESFNFSMKIGLAYATLFSVFSNYLIQTTDWKVMTSQQGEKKLRTYFGVGLTLIILGCLLVSYLPLNQIFFSRERFENLNKWSFFTVLICCLIISTSLLNQVRVQLGTIGNHEWVAWIMFSLVNFLICYITLLNFDDPFTALGMVVLLQSIVLTILFFKIRKCFCM